MSDDLDTFLTVVYCTIDDWYRVHVAPFHAHCPGTRPELSDSEVLTVLILAQSQRDRSEAAFLRYACRHWRGYFPRLLSQSAFNRRARHLLGVVSRLGPALARSLTAGRGDQAAYAVLDSVPVPLMRRCRGRRHRCFADEADFGHGGSDDDWYYGVQLLTVVNPAGLIAGFAVGPACTDDHWLTEALLRWQRDPAAPPPTAAELAPVLGPSHKRGGQRRGAAGRLGPGLGVGVPAAGPYLGELGFRGAAWRRHWRATYDVIVLTKDDYDRLPPAEREACARWFCGLRQVVETVNGLLVRAFGLKLPRARTYWGLLTRLAAKVAAHNLAVYLNHLFGRPSFSSFDPFQA